MITVLCSSSKCHLRCSKWCTSTFLHVAFYLKKCIQYFKFACFVVILFVYFVPVINRGCMSPVHSEQRWHNTKSACPLPVWPGVRSHNWHHKIAWVGLSMILILVPDLILTILKFPSRSKISVPLYVHVCAKLLIPRYLLDKGEASQVGLCLIVQFLHLVFFFFLND